MSKICPGCGGPKDRRAKTCRACVRRPIDPEVQARIDAGEPRTTAYRRKREGPARRPPGRPPKDLPDDLIEVVAELLVEEDADADDTDPKKRRKGLSMSEAAKRLGVHRATLYRRLEALEE